jgi:hypothetical protein
MASVISAAGNANANRSYMGVKVFGTTKRVNERRDFGQCLTRVVDHVHAPQE